MSIDRKTLRGAVILLIAVGLPAAGAAGRSQPTGDSPGGLLVLGCSGCPASEAGPSLYTLTPGGRLRKIPRSEGGSRPSWSPNGRQLVYSDRLSEIRVTTPLGTGTRSLTGGANYPRDGDPDWSPDGRTIVFERSLPAATGSYRTSLWRVPSAGGVVAKLHAPRYGTHSPSWSPDGRWIAYNDARQRLWVVSADGSGQRSLGPPDLRGESPRWSPDGTRIAFRQVGARSALSVLDLATSTVRPLLALVSISQTFWYAWSPDGRWLALARQREYACPSVDGYCEDPEVIGIRVRDRARRLFYTTDGGEFSGIDWRR